MDEASQPPLITRQNAQYYDKILTVSTVNLCTPALKTQNLEPIPSTSHHSHQPPLVSTIDLCTPALESQDFEAVASTSSQVDKESQTDDVIICKKPEILPLLPPRRFGKPFFEMGIDLNEVFPTDICKTPNLHYQAWRAQAGREQEEKDRWLMSMV